jgi:hypothetical protein
MALDERNNVNAELLLAKLNRRTKLLTRTKRTPWRMAWDDISCVVIILVIYGGGFVLTSAKHGDAEGLWMNLSPIVLALAFLIQAHVNCLNARVDALVELLQEEGMLASTLPAANLRDKL